jgi:WD40 repeat protein
MTTMTTMTTTNDRPLLVVDFGTCTSSARLLRNEREDEVCDPYENQPLWPTTVHHDGTEFTVGTRAEARRTEMPSGHAREFKRELGRGVGLTLGRETFTATELAAVFLRAVREEAEQMAGTTVDQVIITKPSSYTFDDPRHADLYDACRQAGFAEVEMLVEPVAASYGQIANMEVSAGEVILVYDFGGGTFDAALVRIGWDRNEVVGEAVSLDDCGGVDIDALICKYLGESEPAAGSGPPGGSAEWQALQTERDVARDIKHALTVETAKTIGPGRTMTRADLERLAEPLVLRTVDECASLISRHPDETVSAVLLVGGTTRMPLVQRLVSDRLQISSHRAVALHHAVVDGGVVFARRRTERNVASVERSFEEIPLRWPIPGGRAVVSRWLLQRGTPFHAGTPLLRVALPEGPLWELRAHRAGILAQYHALPGTQVTSGDWLVTARQSRPDGDHQAQLRPLLLDQSAASDADTLSPEGSMFARLLADRRSVRLVSLADGKEEGPITADSDILGMTFSPTGSALALTLQDGVLIWDRARQREQRLRDGSLRSPVSMSFNADASLLAVYSRVAGALTLWSTSSPELRALVYDEIGRTLGPASVPFFSADGRTVYLVPYRAKRKIIQRWRVPDAGPSGRTGAEPGGGTGGRSEPVEPTRLDDLPARSPLYGCAVTPDDAAALLLYKAGFSIEMAVVDTRTGDTRKQLNVAGLDAMALSPSGRLVATAGESRVRLTDVATGATRGELALTNPCRDLAFSPDGSRLVVLLRGTGPSHVQRYGLVVTSPADGE